MKPGPVTRVRDLLLLSWCEEGVPHTVIPDNTGGHLMQHGMVDMVIVGERPNNC